MEWVLVGLGNPGKEYEGTRHNVGRDVLSAVEKKSPLRAKILIPETYMNDSGKAVGKMVKSKKAAERLAVLHDDLDLPFGRVKLSFGSSSGGHRGVHSIQTVLKTKDFVRIRIGISPATPGGKTKKPSGEEKVVAFVLGKFKPAEQEKLKKVRKTVSEALEILLLEGKEKAMTAINGR
jgi:PTH1 family peptidyl-tRNA hydrolase